MRTLRPPTDFLYINGTYTYNVGEFHAFMRFFNPEREQSTFNSQTRGAAAALSALSLRFNATARERPVASCRAPVHTAPDQPA